MMAPTYPGTVNRGNPLGRHYSRFHRPFRITRQQYQELALQKYVKIAKREGESAKIG